eukprot:1426101-Rhodomonas_salina.2
MGVVNEDDVGSKPAQVLSSMNSVAVKQLGVRHHARDLGYLGTHPMLHPQSLVGQSSENEPFEQRAVEVIPLSSCHCQRVSLNLRPQLLVVSDQHHVLYAH